MTAFTLFGNNSGFLGDGFLDNDGEQNADVLFADATTIILNNPDTGITTTINGTGFAFAGPDGDEQPVSGTITSLSMSSSNNTVLEGTITGVNFDIVAFANSLDGVTADDFQPFANLLNDDGPITIDGSNAPNGLNMFDLLPPELTGLITEPITVLGSGEFDSLYGGIDNDSIVVGSDSGGFAGGNIEGTLGNDTIDFSNVSDTTFQFLDFEDFVNGSVTFNVDAVANTGRITGAGFATTLVDPRRIMEADGLALEGGENNDVFNIVNTDDGWFNLFGNEGNDVYNLEIGGGGRISFNFGSAFDAFPAFGLVADLSTGIVSNDGFGGQDTINVIDGDGRLEIRATDNNDNITGSDRNDSFITEQGNDTVDGGAGQDRVRYDRSGVDAVNVDLAAQTASGTWGGSAFTDTLISIEYVRGSREGDDTLSGAASDDRFEGRGGNDLLRGLAGDDTLEGGDGNDTLQGGLGDDDYFGDDGTDTAIINAASDAISVFEATDGLAIAGSQGDDFIDGSVEFIQFNDTTLSFAALAALAMGDQTLIGDGGNDELVGGLGNDSLVGNGGNDTLRGDDGDDSLRGGNGNDLLFDGQGNDSLIGGTGDDVWVQGGGEDTFNGGDGFDTVLFDLATLTPQSFEIETNLLTGDSGAVGISQLRDVLINVEAVELIGDFNITVTGNDAANVIHTDLGTDSLIGGLGNDLLMAGAGNDTLVGNQGADTLLGENGDDRLDAGLDADSASGGNGNDTIFGGGGFDTLRGGNGDDTVVGGDGRDMVFLGGGNDLFVDNTQGGVNGADTVLANGGNDTIGGGAGNDRFEGQDGNDLLLGRLGNDVLFGGNQNDTIEGGDGNDTVAGGNGADRGFLGNGDDRWFDNAQEQFGNDFVVGGNGNDWIQAGGGNDTLAGGAGADTFVLAASINDDVITDYDVGTDDLDINASLWNGTLNQAQLDALTTVQNGNLVFDFDNGDSLTLNGVNTTAGLLGDIELI